MKNGTFIFVDDIKQRPTAGHTERKDQKVRVLAGDFQTVTPCLNRALLQPESRVDIARSLMTQLSVQTAEGLSGVNERIPIPTGAVCDLIRVVTSVAKRQFDHFDRFLVVIG